VNAARDSGDSRAMAGTPGMRQSYQGLILIAETLSNENGEECFFEMEESYLLAVSHAHSAFVR